MSLDVQPEHLQIIRAILQKHVPGLEVWAFGSRVTGKAKRASDLDLVIKSSQPLSFATLAALRDDFSESNIPYKVDLSDWPTLDNTFQSIIAQSYILVVPYERLSPPVQP